MELLLLFFTKNIPFKNLKSCPNKICQAWSKQIENGSNSVGRRIEGFFFFFVIKHFHLSGFILNIDFFFSSPCQRQCELLPSFGVRRLSSVNFPHFNLLL